MNVLVLNSVSVKLKLKIIICMVNNMDLDTSTKVSVDQVSIIFTNIKSIIHFSFLS